VDSRAEEMELFGTSPTALCNVQPVGIGTLLPEAFSSFLARVARAHCVTVSALISYVLLAMGKRSLAECLLRGSSRLYGRPTLINGMCSITSELIAAMEALTGCVSLLHLTLLPWQGVIDPKGLFKKCLAWCSTCLQEWKSKGLTIYIALPWLLKDVALCPVHLTPLTIQCPRCGRRNTILGPRMYVGYCSNCFTWLASHSSSESFDPPDSYEVWVATNLARLLGEVPNLVFSPFKELILQRIEEYVKLYYRGSASAFARDFQIPLANAKNWIARKSFPDLKHLLVISYLSGTPLTDILLGSIIKKRSVSPGLPDPRIMRSMKHFDYEKVRPMLLKVLSHSESVESVTAVSKKLGYTKRTLYKHFPEICRLISRESARQRKHLREDQLQQESLFIEKAVKQLSFEGFYPSYDRVEAIAPKKGFLRGKEARKVWHASVRKCINVPMKGREGTRLR
jgi:hypothetical protein